MPGLADFMAQSAANQVMGVNVSGNRFMALFSVMPTSDSGTGGTELSGNGYARPQIAGNLTAGASWTTASTTITLSAPAPAWLTSLGLAGTPGSGVNLYDLTTGQNIGTVSSISGSTVTLTTTAAHNSSGSADALQFSAFPLASASSGTEPAVTPVTATNGAQVNFAQSTGAWSAAIGFGIYDAVSSGNLYGFDYLGAQSWLPATISNASPGVITAKAHGFVNAGSVEYTTKFGGTQPTFSQSNLTGTLAAANVTTDTFTVTNASTAVNTSSTGSGMVRGLTSYTVGALTTAQFAAGALTLTVA